MDEMELESLLYGMCLRLISKRPRSVWEIKQYLDKKLSKYARLITDPDESMSRLINRLIQSDFLNDSVFIDWWVDSRSSFRPKGKRALVVELRQKGLSNDDIEQYFESHGLDETSLALDVLRKKERTLSILESQFRIKKATELLLRRGFQYDIAKKAIEKMWYNTSN